MVSMSGAAASCKTMSNISSRTIRQAAIPIAVLLLALQPACMKASAQTLFERDNEFIELAPSGSAKANRHPLRTTPERLANLLVRLELMPVKKRSVLKSKDADESVPLFSDAAAEHLAVLLADAFRKAGPDQDVVFQVRDSVALLGDVIDQEVVTTGRVFWRHKRLHIIFGDIHHAIVNRWLYGQKLGVVKPARSGERGRPARLKYRVVRTEGISFAKMRSGKRRADWVVVNPVVLARNVEQDVEDRRQMKRERGRSSEDSPWLRARLVQLKRLRDQGLISEDTYRHKVDELLDEAF